MRFTCASCGREHDLSELNWGADAPAMWYALSEAEREQSRLSPDQCVILARGEKSHYIRGCLDVTVRDRGSVLTWGVWCSVSENSFDEMSEHWEDPRRTELGPYFGWLCTAVPTYPDTVFLKTEIHQRPVGQRPRVELEPTAHPLAVHQREGIDSDTLRRIVVKLLHRDR